MLKVDKACVWQTPQTLCLVDCFVADAAVLMLPGILSLSGITLTLPVPSKNEQRIEQILPFWKNKQSCQLRGHLCSNPVHIKHQYRTESTHACVKQWPLWENYSLHSFHFCKGSDQWRVSPSECWKLRKLELGRHLRLVADAAVWQASRNPIATSYQESRCLFQFQARMSRASNNFCHAGRTTSCHRSMSCQCCQGIGHSCSNPVFSITSTEQRAHMHVSSSDHC